MRVVLGIDAAWTLKQPSGVAIAKRVGTVWHLVELAPSYQGFNALAEHDLAPELLPCGSRPDAAELLASSRKLCGLPVDLVAIDMPLAHHPIAGRRASDNAISAAYGARKGPSGNNRFAQLVRWSDCVLPFAVEIGALEVGAFHFVV